MKKYILITLFSISHLAFANRENKITFFSNSSKTSDEIDTVDDPDDPNGSPIGDYAFPLLILATTIGFYYTKRNIVVKN